ncbi:MAG: hypothetical protein EHM58_03435 [Ignavibacteriae bacterium]|nr:MAG: hypothetical protein EHM58_03435 [Ignavibacteriota bacterium]
MSKPFHFYTEYNLPLLLGIKSSNIRNLLENIRTVPDASIYYHTHRFLQQHHFLVPEPPNDFAYWIRNVLNLTELGEATASINIASLNNINDVRQKLIKTIEDYSSKDSSQANCVKGTEFQFMSCKTFCLPLDCHAKDLNEFAEQLESISINTFYYHIFETQLRLGKNKNDFADWFETLGYHELAKRVSSLDPYTTTLNGLREDILTLIKTYGSKSIK